MDDSWAKYISIYVDKLWISCYYPMSNTIGIIGECGVREDAGGFVNDEKVFVFENNSNRNVWPWLKCRSLDFRKKNINNIVGFNKGGWFARSLIKEDMMFTNERVNSCTRGCFGRC